MLQKNRVGAGAGKNGAANVLIVDGAMFVGVADPELVAVGKVVEDAPRAEEVMRGIGNRLGDGTEANRFGGVKGGRVNDGLLIVQVDHFGEAYLLAVDAATGATKWRTIRETTVGWASPVPMRVGGQTQIVAAGNYKVKGDNGMEFLAKIGGRMRRYHIRVIPGDRVTIAVSPYDPSHGLIVFRG